MSQQQKALHYAAKDARKAAQKARELADLFEDYANSLLDENWQERAGELRLMAGNKIQEFRDSVAACDDWVACAELRVAPEPNTPDSAPPLDEE